MEELQRIVEKYKRDYPQVEFDNLDDLYRFSTMFYEDVAEIYDCITRLKNIERNPSGYSLNDAPILGLLVRVWKLLKEMIRYHKENNAEFLGILERTLLETAVTATYLLKSDDDIVEDYRKCSYKDRLRILRDYRQGSPFFETKAGKRLLKSVRQKMEIEGLTEDDFAEQKRNRWKLQGKSFFDIFSTIHDDKMYRYTFGISSESVHCSWNDSMDWCLISNEDGTFSTYPFHHPADIRYISPILTFCHEPFKLWLERIDVDEDFLFDLLDWTGSLNQRLFLEFDRIYDE
jgi:hypothetical protein